MKLESLVIADQNAAVNTFPGLVHTARHTMGVVRLDHLLSKREEVGVALLFRCQETSKEFRWRCA